MSKPRQVPRPASGVSRPHSMRMTASAAPPPGPPRGPGPGAAAAAREIRLRRTLGRAAACGRAEVGCPGRPRRDGRRRRRRRGPPRRVAELRAAPAAHRAVEPNALGRDSCRSSGPRLRSRPRTPRRGLASSRSSGSAGRRSSRARLRRRHGVGRRQSPRDSSRGCAPQGCAADRPAAASRGSSARWSARARRARTARARAAATARRS